eukprot:gene7299-8489_t
MSNPNVHPSAKGFQTKDNAASYVKARPQLPAETIDFIRTEFGLTPESVVVDLAAGTGKFTELVATRGSFNNVTCVEPSAEFRDECTLLLDRCKAQRPALNFHVVDGTATAIPLASESVDVIFISQAFHWFSTVEAMVEIARVLKKGGLVMFLWYDMDVSDSLTKDLTDIFHEKYYDGLTPQFRSYKWRAVFDQEAVKAVVATPLEMKPFHFDQISSRDLIVERAMSVSYISLLSAEKKAELAAELQACVDRHPRSTGQETFTIPYRVEIYWTRKC